MSRVLWNRSTIPLELGEREHSEPMKRSLHSRSKSSSAGISRMAELKIMLSCPAQKALIEPAEQK